MTNNLFELNNENKVLEQLENYLFYGKQPKGNKFVINETPSVLQYAGINPLEIEFSTSVINKAKKIHKMTNDEILNTVKKIADPLLVFDSDKLSTENKRDSILLITDEEVSAENKPSAVSMNVNANETNNRYKINAITSIHGRSLIARNGINIMEEWKNKGLLKYADDKKISSLAKAVSQGEPDIQEQFLLPLATLDIENIPCKSDFVNHQEKVQDISNIATELVLEKLKAANINVITDQNEMQAILDAGINVQKMAAHYGTNQNIENAESFNGYGVYVLSVNEENARNFGLKIAAKKYGNSFYINNQPLQEFLQKRNFSPYWQSVISQVQNPSNETLLHSIMTSDVKGNPVLLKEQNQLSTLCGLNLINYKREQTYLYSVEIPDNDGTNYLYYDKSIGLESAERINTELSKLGTNWQVSRNDTGYSVYFNILSNKIFNSQKQASEFLQKIGYVGMETSTANYIIFDDREMNINNRVQYMITENGELYGFAYNGQIYADKNLMNSNVLAHEYTHLWDNYTKNKNPELWELGKNVFKKTAIWNEVVNDPSYQNIRNNEDEILSECHSRIVGKFAQSVLERIAQENGENAKNAVIDWNKEVEAFVAKEFGFAPELGSENYISEAVNAESMKEFLAAPMKDLMNGMGFEKEYMLNKTSSKPDMQIGKTSISGNSPSFPEEPQLSIGSRANHILLQNDDERQAVIKKLDKIKTEKIEPREFLIKLKEAYNFEDRDSSDYVANRINSSRFALRISNHSVNAHYVEKKYVEISIVIRLSYNEFQDESDKYVAEFNYTPEMLTPEKKHQIVENLKNWTITGQYPETEVKPTYSPNEAEWKKANEKMLEFVNKSKLQKMVLSDEKEKNMNKDGYLFNHETVERKSLSEADENRLQEDFDVIGNFENAVGQWSEYSNITNFFDFHNHSDEFLKFMDAAREEKEISGHKDNISFVQHYLENKLEIPIYKDGERISPNWTEEEREKYSSVVSRLNFIAQAIVNSNETYIELSSGNEGVIHNSEKLELLGAKDITELEKTLQKIKDELNPQYHEHIENDNDYVDPIEALEESYNTPLNPPTEEDIEAEKILHDKYIQDELDKTIEDLQVNGGLSDAAIEAEIAAQEETEAYEEDSSYDEEEEPVLTFNDTNGNPHFPQEIVAILENFQKVESSKWNLPIEEKTAVFHLIQLTEMDKNDFENSLAKLQEYMNTEEFKREEENYAKIFTPILLTRLGQDYDKETQTFSSEKFLYKFSTDELKEEIPVTKGEIKSILDNDFTGGNIKLTQDFQNELIEKGLVKPEEKFILINEVEAVAKGTKIKPDQPYVTLTIPVDNNGKTEFVQTKYYHVSSLEEPQKFEKTIDENATQVDKNIIIYGETKVPEFAMITQHGLENFKEMIIDSFEESSGTYLLKSEDGKNNVRVTENTLKTLTSDEYAKKTESYTQDTKTAEKMIDTQYNDFFELRDNCANNFRHNLSVFCHKEANSPLDALKIANHIISEMPKEEKRKTKELLNLLRKDGQSVNEVLIETFHEAVKEIPLNEDYIKHHRYEKMIARPMYDTLSTKGEKIDRDFDLKIGDSVEVVFKVNKDAKTHFLRKESIYQNCTIISSSKENNMVTLMDGNKSFYDVPRDTFLAEYGKQQYKAQKIEHKIHCQQSMQIEIGR